MTASISISFLVFVAALIAGGLGSLTYSILAQWLKAPGWVALWGALTIALFVMACIVVS